MTAPKQPPARKAGATITEHRLRNGLRILLAERHLDPVVAVMLWYGVGSRHERSAQAGVSHFLEHMMFKGTACFGKGEVDRITTELGGNNNAFTSADHTAFWFELASDRWEAALEIEADRMRNLLFDADEFESEKAVVLEELAMGLDDPWRSLTAKVQEVLFGRHPYARPIIGYSDVLKRMTPADMRSYYRRFYRPDNATLVLCGDFQPQSALRAVRKHFASLPRHDSRGATSGATSDGATATEPPIAEPRGEWRLTTHWDDQASRLAMAWPTAAVATDEDYALDLVSAVLTNGRLARLYRDVVLERGLAVNVGSSNDTRVDGGCFWLYAEGVQGVDPTELERALDTELARLTTENIGAAELRRAKATLAAAEAYEGETVSDLAEGLGEYAVDATWRDALEITARRNAITARAVREVAARRLRPERRVIGWSLPRATDPPAQVRKRRPATRGARGASV